MYLGYWYEMAAVGSGNTSVWQGEVTIGKQGEDGVDKDVLLEYLIPGEFQKMREAIAAVDSFARSFIDRIGGDDSSH
jgi:hypothetical protein